MNQSQFQENEAPVQDFITMMLRGRWLILGTFVAVTALVAIYTFTAPRVYESTAMVLIDVKAGQGALPMFDLQGAAVANKITNEMETLRSNSMADEVAHALLATKYLDSTGTRPIGIIQDENAAQPRTLGHEEVIRRLKRTVDFTQVKESDIIKITARSNDPDEAALLANTYAKVYENRNLNSSRMRSRALREFLQNQVEEKHDSLNATENALQNYMRASGMVNLDADTRKTIDQLASLEASRDALEVDISSRSKTLENLRQELATQEPNAAKAIGESNDAYVRLLQEQLAKLEVQRDQVIAQNPGMTADAVFSQKLKQIDVEIASMKKNLETRTQAYLRSILPGDATGGDRLTTTSFLAQLKQKIIEQQMELAGLAARKAALRTVIADYEQQFNQIPKKSMELAKLQRARLSNEKLYLMVEERYNEAAINESSEFGYVNVMDSAMVSYEPASPKVAANIVLGALFGLGLGVGLVFVRSRLDDRLRTPEDLKRLGYVHLSSISRMFLPKLDQSGRNGSTEDGKKMDKHLVAYYNPLSAVTESYRNLRVNILSLLPMHQSNTLLVTSGAPGEGKSTTAANLAICFAQAEKRVILIETDMRRPAVHTMFGLSQEPGLSEMLLGRNGLDAMIHRDVLRNLDVISCGAIPPNPAEILGSARMMEFISRMSKAYDIVLLDTPPVLAATDAVVLSRFIGGVLLVVSSGTTQRDILARTAESLKKVGANVLGVVLNNFDVGLAYGRKHESYSYGYGYATSLDGKKKSRKKIPA